jgi:hypothetical protein
MSCATLTVTVGLFTPTSGYYPPSHTAADRDTLRPVPSAHDTPLASRAAATPPLAQIPSLTTPPCVLGTRSPFRILVSHSSSMSCEKSDCSSPYSSPTDALPVRTLARRSRRRSARSVGCVGVPVTPCRELFRLRDEVVSHTSQRLSGDGSPVARQRRLERPVLGRLAAANRTRIVRLAQGALSLLWWERLLFCETTTATTSSDSVAAVSPGGLSLTVPRPP